MYKPKIIDTPLNRQLTLVREGIAAALVNGPLGKRPADLRRLCSSGKLLRSRLMLRLANARHIPKTIWLPSAIAVELVHTASLLHDDIIDGALLRRHAPTFWKTHGLPGALLAGDLLLTHSSQLLLEDGFPPSLARDLTSMARIVCEGEIAQEFRTSRPPLSAPAILRIDRQKTGPLFAFAAGIAGYDLPPLKNTLMETGHDIGMIYQLADDFCDAHGSSSHTDKTLGRDQTRRLATAARFPLPVLLEHIHTAIARARHTLLPWPALSRALDLYFQEDFLPILRQFLDIDKNALQ